MTGFGVSSRATKIDSDIGLINEESSGQEDDKDVTKRL
jgi:hypothetical protein